MDKTKDRIFYIFNDIPILIRYPNYYNPKNNLKTFIKSLSNNIIIYFENKNKSIEKIILPFYDYFELHSLTLANDFSVIGINKCSIYYKRLDVNYLSFSSDLSIPRILQYNAGEKNDLISAYYPLV